MCIFSGNPDFVYFYWAGKWGRGYYRHRQIDSSFQKKKSQMIAFALRILGFSKELYEVKLTFCKGSQTMK
jgi:hypothetical protein